MGHEEYQPFFADTSIEGKTIRERVAERNCLAHLDEVISIANLLCEECGYLVPAAIQEACNDYTQKDGLVLPDLIGLLISSETINSVAKIVDLTHQIKSGQNFSQGHQSLALPTQSAA